MDNRTDTQAQPAEEIRIFEDETMPEFYSQKAIFGFSLLCGSFFGSVMLAMNIRRTESKKGVWQVVLFGFGYNILITWVMRMLNSGNSLSTIAYNLPGALALNKVFWDLYIGKDVRYHYRSLMTPFVIAVMIVVVLVAFVIYKQKMLS